jgi:hypothetical protein
MGTLDIDGRNVSPGLKENKNHHNPATPLLGTHPKE